MTGFILRRLALFIPMMFGVILVAFLLIQLVPGDPAQVLLGNSATPEQIARLRGELGLDDPLLVRFVSYLGDLAHFDLGRSYFLKQDVLELVAIRLPATLELAFGSILVSVILGVPLGVIAARFQGRPLDLAISAFAQLGVALTVFWLAIMLMYIFAVRLAWLPAIGRGMPVVQAAGQLFLGRLGPLLDSLAHLIMPSIAMGLQGAAMITRLVRASMLDALSQPYVQTARAKGAPDGRVTWIHALANAMVPTIAVIGLQFGNLLSGAVLVEGIFGWPGLGQLTVSAISQRDFPLVQGLTLCFAVLFGLITLATDVVHAMVDPRVRT